MASILDQNFKYYSAQDTDLRRTFRRIRRQLRDETVQAAEAATATAPVRAPVLPLAKRQK
jgi:hypothetical protein